MSIVAIGLNHRTAPLDLFERMTVNDSDLPKALHALVARRNLSEAVVVSTCNRTEVYAVAERFHGAFHDIREWFSEISFLPPEEFSDYLYVHYDDEAAEHLFQVAAGLDSAVIGESEILGQVRRAWEVSRQESTSSSALNLLFRHAVEVGKRARTDTAISRGITSLSQAAVVLAGQRLDGLEGRRILVLGAGAMGEGMVRSLHDSGISELLIANRTWEKSVGLAEVAGGTPVRLAELDEALAGADVLLTSTGASTMMLDHADLERAMARRNSPLLIVDIAVPRDVDPSAGDIDGVTLLDMDDLRSFVDGGIEERQREVARVREVLAEELDRFSAVATAREVAPLVTAFRELAEDVRSGELERFAGRLDALDPEQTEAVEALTKGIVAKLLHDPTVELKDAAGSPRGERLADALRDLFSL